MMRIDYLQSPIPLRASPYIVPIREKWMAQLSVQFINENFFRWARPHKGFRRGVLYVRRSRKPAENAAQRKKGHL